MTHDSHDQERNQRDQKRDQKRAQEAAPLLAALESVPRAELPDGGERNALAMLIRYGLVDNLYKPLGANYHNIAWAYGDPQRDPRERISAWLERRRLFWNTPNLAKLTPEQMVQRIKEIQNDQRNEQGGQAR